MKICFLLPTPGDTPIGGVKVVYEHASGLAARGHEVTVAHTTTYRTKQEGKLKNAGVFLGRLVGLKGGYGPRRWMEVHPLVQIKFVPSFSPTWIPRHDVIVATAWRTAEWLKAFPEEYGSKFYFVQDYEYFMTAASDVKSRMSQTYRDGLRNIVISPACEQMVIESGGAVHAHVPNGIDLSQYSVHLDINSPQRIKIGFPARPEKFKCTSDAIAALAAFKESNPSKNWQFWTFGGQRPQGLPDWIEFHHRPSDDQLTALYNESAIFLVPSVYEGWGLPGSEAMACGAALISVDNGGVRAYAEDGLNAVICAANSPSQLVNALTRLTADSGYRFALARRGADDLKKFTWENSRQRMERALCG